MVAVPIKLTRNVGADVAMRVRWIRQRSVVSRSDAVGRSPRFSLQLSDPVPR